MTRIGKRLAVTTGVLSALVPLLLFLYLGHFSRLMGDDYRFLGNPIRIGILESVLFGREYWSGHYSNLLLYTVLAPLGAIAPSIFPMIISVSGVLGFVWLILRLLAFLGIRRHRFSVAVPAAALALAATYNGFHTSEVFFWLAATMAYTAPATLLLPCLALVVAISRHLSSGRRRLLAAIAVAALSFMIAGFSEMFVVFYLSVSAIFVVCIYRYVAEAQRRVYLVLAFATCVGGVASLIVQISAPGVAYRASLPVNVGYTVLPVREIPALLSRTAELLLQYAGHEAAFAGFTLMLATGMLVTLTRYSHHSVYAQRTVIPVETRGLWLCLIAQIVLLPFLLAHSSDGSLFFWRFSARYTLILSVNLAAILAFALLLWKRNLLGIALNARHGLMIYCSVIMLAILLLFATTQLLSIHYRVSSYCFLSAIALLALLCRQLAQAGAEPRANRLLLLAEIMTVTAALTFAAIAGVSLWAQGFVVERTFAPITFVLTIAGLLWGALAGALIKNCHNMALAKAGWIRGIWSVSLIVAIIIATGIVIGRASQIEGLAAFARDWDASHAEILRLRAEGDPSLHTREFLFLAPKFIGSTPRRYAYRRLNWQTRLFYGLDYEPSF